MRESDFGYEIGVDIGGTFTDVVCRSPGQPLRTLKVPSTRKDPSEAVLQSIQLLREKWGIRPEEIVRFTHGTTVATNAVLERKGARIGILTTRGFRDTLEIGRQMRQAMYKAISEPETPIFLAPRELRREVSERIAATGKIVTPLDEAELLEAVGELVSRDVSAIAVCFLFSFINPAHEQRARELITAAHPHLAISLSHEVDPAFREYERTVVTAFDGYIKPVVDRYLANLQSGLSRAGVKTPLQVMQSRGGLANSAVARARPVRLFLSGPAAGVIGGRIAGAAAGVEDIITVDIGGTSCDIALIARGKPLIRSEGVIGDYPVRVAMVDVNTIGSGGGSIARIDSAGGLRVGPQSAGSEPGPACYARGGEDATVTDASVVLGYLNPEFFAGGTLRLDKDLAYRAVETRVAKPLGLTVDEAAAGIHRVLNAQMAEGIRLVSIRQGIDPRTFSLVPLGGAGAVHATALARELGLRQVLLPRYPGVLSAAGLLAAPVEHEVSTAFVRPIAELSMTDVSEALRQLDRRCAELIATEQVDPAKARISYFADVCYIGQSYHLEIPFSVDPNTARQLSDDFVRLHDQVYGYSTPSPARIVNLRAVHRFGGLDDLNDGTYEPVGTDPRKGTRSILVSDAGGRVEATVLAREALPVGYTFEGPAIIEQADTTTVIEPGWNCTVDSVGNVLIAR